MIGWLQRYRAADALTKLEMAQRVYFIVAGICIVVQTVCLVVFGLALMVQR